MKRSLVAACAAVLALSLAGCTAESPAAESTPTPSLTSTVDLGEHSTPTPTPQPGTKAEPMPLGETAPAGSGSQWDVTITDTSADATAELVDENPHNEPDEGWQYVAGTITATVNDSMKPEHDGVPAGPGVSVEPVFVGGDGVIYTIWRRDNSAPVLTDAWSASTEIINAVGVTVTGRFAIEIPASAAAGGQFAVRNIISGELVYFGPAL